MIQNCFGFFGVDGNKRCVGCELARECRAILVSDGLPLIGGVISESIEMFMKESTRDKLPKTVQSLLFELMLPEEKTESLPMGNKVNIDTVNINSI